MGYPKLTYDDYIENIDYWKAQGVELPKWSFELSERGFQSVSAIDFYDDIFGDDLEPSRMPEDYRSGEYGAIAVELLHNGIDAKGKPKFTARRHTVTQGQQELYELIDSSDNFCMMSALSYAGKNRTNANARYLYALVIEIDGIKEKTGIAELIYSWERKNLTMPQPTYMVCSGNGLHLYFVFERPIPLFAFMFEQMSAAKTRLTRGFWSSYVTKEWDRVQYESVNQAFRCVGTRAKNGKSVAMAFQTGAKITIEYLNRFLPPELQMNAIYKSKLSLEAAKERYPEWYQRRIVEGGGRKHWHRHDGIYYDWIAKVRSGAEVGKRYNCLENLCSLAVQCQIPPEQVEKDCWELAEYLETLTVKDDNHFTDYDVICALRTYHKAEEAAYRRKIEYVTNKTGIPLERNKRRKKPFKRDDGTALKAARMMQDLHDPTGEWRNKNGRPTAEAAVRSWRESHPDGTKAECNRDTGIDPKTIRKWWNKEENVGGQ